MRILKEESVAVIVDVQERLYPHIHDHDQLSKNLHILIEGLITLDVPIIVTEQYKKGLGETIPEISDLIKNFPHSEKLAFSCCEEPSFMELICKEAKKNVIIAGIESHICIMQTAFDLLDKGYRPVIIEDCVASRNYENKRIAINRFLQSGITVTSSESLLFELCRIAKGETFKAISKIVK